MIGKTLGPYKIIEPLGGGGMGEVYLGEDTRLGRKVAVKVLPAEFAGDPERLARFEQEARAAAALNHPHIAVVHDIGFEPAAVDDAGAAGEAAAGAATGTHYMVQEYLEGQSLRERLDKGALPIGEALDLAVEAGEALIAAHKAGIVHRDLKPDNIFVTEEGHAKVLDFGLAKLTEAAAPTGASASMSPTMLGTVAGQVMGTAGFMAPEQINGEEVDNRADLFAFGCVLYGMVTGRQAFAGKNVHETLGKILSDEPPSIAEVDDSLPVELYRIIRKALAKSPNSRYQTAGDLVIDLRSLGSDVETGATQPLSGKVPVMAAPVELKAGIGWKIAVPAVVVTAVVAVIATMFATGTDPEPVRRFRIPYPTDTTFQARFTRGLDISPDGTRIAFNADRQLWMRSVDDFDAAPIRGTEGSRAPSFSPDGQQLAFWGDDGQMKKVAITGGAPISLGSAPRRAFGASWADDGNIYFGQGPDRIFRVSENGGEPQLVVAVEDGEYAGSPQLLPDGEWLLFTLSASGTWADASIVAQSLSSDDRKVLVSGGTDGRYVPTGHLVYTLDGNLLAAPFDVGSVERTSGPVALVEGVAWSNGSGSAQYAFSQRGGLVYVPGAGVAGGFKLVWADRRGDIEPLDFEPRLSNYLSLSPDGRRIAVEVMGGEGSFDIWILDIDTGAELRLTAESSSRMPLWSPDGEWLFFHTDHGGDWDIWRQRADRSQAAELVLDGEGIQRPFSISADGATLLFDVGVGQAGQDIGVLDLSGEPTAKIVLATPAAEARPSVSPDGRFFAFQSNESGSSAVYVQEIATGSVFPVSTEGPAGAPEWSKDGNEIFFGVLGSQMWAAAVTTEPQFSVAATVEIGRFVRRALSNFNATADGQRFLATVPANNLGQAADEGPGPGIDVVLNWFEELKRRAPRR